MTDERLTIGELGAYTNNSPNKEGIKKLVDKVNTPSVDAYTKAETDALLDDKQDVLTAGDNITISDNVISASGGNEPWVECEYSDVNLKSDYEYLFCGKLRNGSTNAGFMAIVSNAGINDTSKLDYYYGDVKIAYDSVMASTLENYIGQTIEINMTSQNKPVLKITNIKFNTSGGNCSIDCTKTYDMAGNVINSTNIDQFIDSNNVILKPFVVDEYIVTPAGLTVVKFNSTSSPSYLHVAKVDTALKIGNLKTAIIEANTSYGLYSQSISKQSLSVIATDYKIYRRLKSELVTPTP